MPHIEDLVDYGWECRAHLVTDEIIAECECCEGTGYHICYEDREQVAVRNCDCLEYLELD